jgi:hypothetical protein
MSSSNENGASYQKEGSGNGSYEPINGNASPSGGKKKWLIAAVLVAVGAVGLFSTRKTPGAATDAAMIKAALPTSKTGKLKLFDSNG